MTGNDIVKKITEVAFKNGMDVSRAFSDMLDSFITFLSVERLQENDCNLLKVMQANENDKWFETFMMWVEWVYEKQKRGVAVDAFDFYEESVKSKGKAQILGQFYTPMPICDLMAEVTYAGDKEVSIVNDSAVGSGRTLLGYQNVLLKKRSPEVAYYIANDIDEQSVKMCTLNLAINNVMGRVLCADGLTLHYNWGYEINETKYPIHSDIASIRRLPNSKYSDNHEERQRECIAMMTLEDDRREKLQALYKLRIGNIGQCLKLIVKNKDTHKIFKEAELMPQLKSISRAMQKYYNIPTDKRF